jgi:periplasmic divalent cation tolerance protein
MNDVCEVVITGDDPEWLTNFTKRLVEDRLAASGHILPIRSVYRWQNRIYDKAESRVMLHTRLSLLPHIVERADQEHSYAVPCVVALPIEDGNPAYVQWILDSTTDVG